MIREPNNSSDLIATTAVTPTPLRPASDGRDSKRRFKLGNSCGRGNPIAKKVQTLRQALLEAVSEEDLRQIVAALVRAAREVLDRTIGKPVQSDFLQRIEELEMAVDQYAGCWERPAALLS